MDKPEQFDNDGRDPQLVGILKFYAEQTGQHFSHDRVPPFLCVADFWREVERRGELITASKWMLWRRTMDEAVLHEIWRIEKNMGHEHPFAVFMSAALPAPLEENMTSAHRWKRKKRHHVDRLAGELGPDDEFVAYMKSTLPTASGLAVPGSGR